jgi:hypothetical protein
MPKKPDKASRSNPEPGGSKFPAATIAYYGPDDRHATKVVVGIIAKPGGVVVDMRKWASGEIDVRNNTRIHDDIREFIRSHHINSMIVTDRIIGCPHEEGDDYPEGAPCPMCPFWINRDRWSGELLE